MLKLLALLASTFIATQVSAAGITTLNCTVAKTKETFSLKVKIGPKVIEEIINDKDDNYITAADGTDVSYLGQSDISELPDGSQVFETDMDGIEMYTLTLTSASGFTKGSFQYRVLDHVTSSGKSYKSPVSCAKK